MSAQTCEVVFDIYTVMCYIIITARGSLTDAWSLLGRVTVKSKRRRHVFLLDTFTLCVRAPPSATFSRNLRDDIT